MPLKAALIKAAFRFYVRDIVSGAGRRCLQRNSTMAIAIPLKEHSTRLKRAFVPISYPQREFDSLSLNSVKCGSRFRIHSWFLNNSRP